MKTYLVEIINGEWVCHYGCDARLCLSAAMKLAKKFVKKGKTVRILCGNELVWEGNSL